MCIIFLSYHNHPRYKLILAGYNLSHIVLISIGNRDEYFDRETTQAYFWKEHPSLLAGADLRKGG
jgi:uncharacterized protein with NRDE domain